MMCYTGDIQETVIREKMRLLIEAVAENIGDNDEAVDSRGRTPDKLEYQDGFEYVAPAWLSFYWSSGTGTPLHDTLIERLLNAQEREWAEQFPSRKSIADILTSDDENAEFRSEAEEWEMAAFEDEAIYIRVEVIRDAGDIKFRSCFMNEINVPYGVEFEKDMPEEEFLALEGEELEALGNAIAAAPYEAKLESGE